MRRGSRVVLAACAAVVIGGVACHSRPAAIPFFGARGALDSSSRERLTYSLGSAACPGVYCVPFRAYAPTWTEDGQGVLHTFSPRPPQPNEIRHLFCYRTAECIPLAADPLDRCISLLPSTGGSGYWDVCEERHANTDLTDILQAAALNTSGRLIYVESTGPDSFSIGVTPRSDFWVVDTSSGSTPQRLTESDGIGPAAVTEAAWIGASTFLAAGAGHLERGVIEGGTIAFTPLNVPGGVTAFALLPGANAVIVVNNDNLVRRFALSTGSDSTVATLPASEHATDIGCHADRCAVLANDGDRWTIWNVDLHSGEHTAIYATAGRDTIFSAELSPTSSDIVIQQDINLYLLPGAGA